MDSVLSHLPFVLAVAAAGCGLLQALLARRLDLGPLTVAFGLSALADGTLDQGAASLLVVAAVLAAWSWRAGSAAGVGRPDLMGLVLVVSAVSLLTPSWLHPWWPTVPADALITAGRVATLLAGAITIPLARERRGLSGQRVFHYREVPIGGGTAASQGEAP